MIATKETPWGFYDVHLAGPNFWFKTLHIAPGQSTSLQTHAERTEYWTAVDSNPIPWASLNGHEAPLDPKTVTVAGVGVPHRLFNPGQGWAVVVEFSVGRPREDDIIRLYDPHNR